MWIGHIGQLPDELNKVSIVTNTHLVYQMVASLHIKTALDLPWSPRPRGLQKLHCELILDFRFITDFIREFAPIKYKIN